ncbi:MAG: cytochrome c [Chloroflexi bacterium]|nr:MAG: cytochrome c [Chloroflexota bacterium]MBL1197430.1 cytochrome c [Chloroflexota bacterium]NOH14725.1 cytochrome c [Chloroflexota bacterium]
MRRPFIVFTLLAVSLVIATGMASAQDVPPGDPVNGGKLYDNWFNALDALPPEGDHPLWQDQTENPRTGAITWRCKECHGWDYKGADGAFALGSEHYTGFPGVISSVSMDTDEIRAWLDGRNNPNHDFSPYINEPAINDLIVFLRTRLVDTDLLVDPQLRVALGNSDLGFDRYEENCAYCHGDDGSQLNFASAATPLFLGDTALTDPWQVIHKIRFSHPATDIPAAEVLGWTLQDVADLVAYTQTMPPANQESLAVAERTPVALPVESQGDIGPITMATLSILALLFLSLGWSAIVNRSS